MKKKTVTILAIAHSKRVCDPQPNFIDRMEVRRLVMNAYRSGYNKAKTENKKYSLIADDLIQQLHDYAANIISGSDDIDDHDKCIVDSCLEYFRLRKNEVN